MKRTAAKATTAQKLTSVCEGERVQMTVMGGEHGVKNTLTIGAYHPTEPSNKLGHWFCVTHDEHFANQMQKDTHINQGTHHLAWICHEHGIEQPTKEPIV